MFRSARLMQGMIPDRQLSKKSASHSSAITTEPSPSTLSSLNTAIANKAHCPFDIAIGPDHDLQNVGKTDRDPRAPRPRLPRLLHRRSQHPHNRQHPRSPTRSIRARRSRSQHTARRAPEKTGADLPWSGACLLRGCHDAEVRESCC